MRTLAGFLCHRPFRSLVPCLVRLTGPLPRPWSFLAYPHCAPQRGRSRLSLLALALRLLSGCHQNGFSMHRTSLTKKYRGLKIDSASSYPACAQVAELADALASGASGRKVVEVRVLSWAPLFYYRPFRNQPLCVKRISLRCHVDIPQHENKRQYPQQHAHFAEFSCGHFAHRVGNHS